MSEKNFENEKELACNPHVTIQRIPQEIWDKEMKYWESVSARKNVLAIEKEINQLVYDANDMLDTWRDLQNDDNDWWDYQNLHNQPKQILRKAMDLLNVCHDMNKNGRVPVGIVDLVKILANIIFEPTGYDDYSNLIHDIAWDLYKHSNGKFLQYDLLDVEI